MLTPTVGEHLDIVNDVITGCLPRPIRALRRALALQAAKKAIRLPVKSRFVSQKLIAELTKQLSTRNLAKRFTGLVSSYKQAEKSPSEDADDDIFARLPETLQLIELMIEHCSRFETYLAEVQAVRELGISFQDWRHLTPTDETKAQAAQLVYITVSPQLH